MFLGYALSVLLIIALSALFISSGAFSVAGSSIGGKTLTIEKDSKADGGIGVRKTLSLYCTVLDFVEVHQLHNGIRIDLNMEQLTSLIESITSMVRHNPEFIGETLDYFNDLQIDPNVIKEIVVNNINNVL